MTINNALIDKINREFLSTDLPLDAEIVGHSGVESQRLKTLLAGREWNKLTQEDLQVVPGSMLLLTPAAFKYYLPAYLSTIIHDYDSAGSAVDSLISRFIDPNNGIIPIDALKALKTDATTGISRAELEQVKAMLLKNCSNPAKTAAAHDEYRRTMLLFTKGQLTSILEFVNWLIAEHGSDDLMGDCQRAKISLAQLLAD